MTQQNLHDVIIIGGGAAALSAALVLARAQARVLVIDGGQPRNAPADQMHGFLSRDGMPPADLLATGRREVGGYGGVIRSAAVTAIATRDDGYFAVTLDDGTIERTRAVLVATGLTDELPDIPGASERWGSTVHHCPYCHGFEVSDQTIVVIGSPAMPMSVKQAGLLRSYSDRVSLVTNGIPLDDAQRQRLEAIGVTVIDGSVSHLSGEPGHLDGIVLAGGRTVACEAAFVAPRPRPNDALLRNLGCDVNAETGLVTASATGETSIRGVWAAGNVVTPTAQVITAAGAGSAAAIAINGWLLEKNIDAAVAARP